MVSATLVPTESRASEPSLAETFNLEAFVDAYAGVNWGFPKPGSPAPAPGVTSGNGLRAFDVNNGASLHWVGLNASHDPDPVGGTVSLRFGPSSARYAGADAAPGVGLEYVKQAFGTYRPGGKEGHLTLDFGKFDAPVSSEVADNPYNANYTRSLLFYLGQPYFFTGLRAGYVLSERLELKVIAANGWNDSIDNNRGKTLGGTLTVRPADTLAVSAAYFTGPEQPSTPSNGDSAEQSWRHFVDLVVDFAPGRRLRVLANGSWAAEPGATWYGANLAARWRFSELFALSGRAEGYWDPDGASTLLGSKTRIGSGTLTFLLTPAPRLWFFVDHRVDVADHAIYQRSASSAASSQFTSTFGVVVSTSAKAGM